MMFRDYKDFWLYDKYKQYIEIIPVRPQSLWDDISAKTGITYGNQNRKIDSIFDWNEEHYSFFFNYINCETEVSRKLKVSSMANTEYVLIDIASDLPIFKTNTDFFIRNWYDFVSANMGLGSFVVSDDYKHLIEFTDDAYYMAFSNFKIM